MLLAVDIGNTNITLGIFDGEKLINSFNIVSNIQASQEHYENELRSLCNFEINDCIIVSVVDELNMIFKSACCNVFNVNPIIVTDACIHDMKLKVAEPKKVGTDRLINAYAAIKKYPRPAIVVDIGTAITFDIVSQEKEFLGGIIMPGLDLQFKSLNEYTSKLPLIAPNIASSAIGNSTRNAILSGVIRGTAASIEGLIKQCEDELGEPACIIATGGQCKIIAEYLDRKFDFIKPNLTLEGLKNLHSSIHVNLY